MASDFVVGRFRFLRRLLLLHGFWCYERIARMILYFFYKNCVSKNVDSDVIGTGSFLSHNV